MASKQFIAISGPTGVGKTAFAIDLALKIGAEIISFDSRQIFKEMNIGVARPHVDELSRVRHHLIAHKSLQDHYSAQDFVSDFKQITEDATQSAQRYILCGGTGFYLRALEYGLDELPDISPATRDSIQKEFDDRGLEYIQDLVRDIDPKSYETMETTNPRRLQRILEIWREHNLVYSELISKNTDSVYDIKHIVLDISREILYHRINNRVDNMMASGLLDEVISLYPHRNQVALQTVGYSELMGYIDGQVELDFAIDKIKQHSRNYAKRQITWNKKYIVDGTWVNPLEDKNWIERFRETIKS